MATVNARTFMISGKRVAIHSPGLSSYNIENNLAILYIPKNASTALKSSIKGNSNWIENTDFRKHAFKNLCVILRDPVSRFLSTVNMYLSGRPILSNYVDIKNNGDSFYINDTNDAHFLEQVYFLLDLDHSHIDFFYYNDNIIEDINSYYGLTLENKIVNSSKKIISDVDKDIINQIYEKDYTLIKSVNFVNVKKGETL